MGVMTLAWKSIEGKLQSFTVHMRLLQSLHQSTSHGF